jgi:predicted DNA-binding transcriptional regulator AlpA
VFIEHPRAFVGAAEGAKLLGLSRSGFLKFVRAGQLPSPARLGRRALWDTAELIAAVRRSVKKPRNSSRASMGLEISK